jgi:hypothetical protein
MARAVNFSGVEARPTSEFLSPVVEANPGDIVRFDFMVEALLGAPTAASLAFKFQVRPLVMNGGNLNINSESEGVRRPWVDVLAAGPLGVLLVNGDWPATGLDQAYPRTLYPNTATSDTTSFYCVSRAIRVGPLFCQVRAVTVSTFTGGNTPKWVLTGMAGIERAG